MSTNSLLSSTLGTIIGDAGVALLADVLRFNTSITAIDLRRNQIYFKGLVSLANALWINSSVSKIFLEYNDIGSEGVALLAKVVRKNKTIKYIDIDAYVLNEAFGMYKTLP